MDIREATIEDLDFLDDLENRSFALSRRSSRRAIRNSLLSSHQIVLIACLNGARCGSMTLMLHQKHVRIYSLSVLSSYQGQGVGGALLRAAIEFSKQHNLVRITLEADINDERLVRWYESFGFEADRVIVNYYGLQEDGLKMVLKMDQDHQNRNIVVTDFDTDFFDGIENVTLIRANRYIEDDTYKTMKNARVFNLCSSLNYQTVGYYVSLLALARNHCVYPNIISLRDIKNSLVLKSIGDEMYDQIQRELANEPNRTLVVDSVWGFCEKPAYQNLVKILNSLYEAPLIRYQLKKDNGWSLQRVSILKLSDFKHREQVRASARRYFSRMQFVSSALNRYDYDMAILVDHEEAFPPSCRIALDKFKQAAKAQGFYVEFITRQDYRRIPEFDALFIRATTNVSNYTYDFSRYAYAEGLVVMDDPWSILRCSNKLYLFEAMRASGIPTPRTWTINKKSDYMAAVDALEYPIVLKQPDSAFSLGVYKVDNREACLERLNELLKISEIIIAQEFMPTDYDWRIGILDRKPIYACKYYMAKNHWQIYNWRDADQDNQEGDAETLPIENVPRKVLVAAVKSANIIGDGIYGIDIKEIAGRAVVIEVNDNPSIDFGVEDAYLGDQLYATVMKSFYTRLENDRRTIRKISY